MSGHEWVVIINPDRYVPTYHAIAGYRGTEGDFSGVMLTACGQAWRHYERSRPLVDDSVRLRWQHADQFAKPCRTCYRRFLP